MHFFTMIVSIEASFNAVSRSPSVSTFTVVVPSTGSIAAETANAARHNTDSAKALKNPDITAENCQFRANNLTSFFIISLRLSSPI
jgi:hypothetical protein